MISPTRYVDRWRLTGSLQPFAARNVRLYGFAFRTEPERTAKLAQRYLNAPTSGRTTYLPVEALPFVFITFMHIGRLSSTASPYRDVGWTAETEAAIWLFTPDRERSRLVWFAPYAFVDLPLGLIHGREIYGAERDIGWFGFPHHPAFPTGKREPERLVLDAFGTPKFGPDEEWRRYRLFTISRDTEGVTLAAQWTGVAECARALAGQLSAAWPKALSHLAAPLSALWQPQGTTVFLKQLYDAADSSRASYQALVEVTVGVPLDRFRGGGLLSGRYSLDLRDSDTHPIARDIGLRVGAQPAALAFWLDCDLELGRGNEVWRAAASAR